MTVLPGAAEMGTWICLCGKLKDQATPHPRVATLKALGCLLPWLLWSWRTLYSEFLYQLMSLSAPGMSAGSHPESLAGPAPSGG